MAPFLYVSHGAMINPVMLPSLGSGWRSFRPAEASTVFEDACLQRPGPPTAMRDHARRLTSLSLIHHIYPLRE